MFPNYKSNTIKQIVSLSNQREKYLLSLRNSKILEKCLNKVNQYSNQTQLKNLEITNFNIISQIKTIDDIIILINRSNLEYKEFEVIYFIIFSLKISAKYLSEKIILKLNLHNFFTYLL